MPKVEFDKIPLPTTPEELPQFLEATRQAFLESRTESQEAIKKLTADVEKGHEAVAESKRQAKKIADLEESLKAMHEAGRIHGDGGKLERQLRALPQVHDVKYDEGYKGRVAPNLFNILALTRKELKMYLGSEAYEWAIRFRKLNDMMLTAHDIMRSVGSERRAVAEEYERRGGFKGLKMFPAMQECWKEGARAIDTSTAGGVSEWVPTLYSADRFDDVKDQLRIASLFNFAPMPQSPWTIPVNLWGMTAYVIAEATADSVGGGNPPITASDPVSSNRTLTAKKLATLSWFSREIEQDSIVPILPLYDVAQIYAQAYGLDNAVLNGQSTSTIDTGSDPGATDVRDHFDGLRWNAQQVGSQVDLSAGLTAEKLAAMIRVMGKYADPARCSFITGYAGLAQALILKDVNGNLVYLTRERAGDAATLFTGQVGILMGYPLAVGGVYPQNMNAAGVIDGVTTTKTGVLLCNRDPWLGGNRQGLEVEVSRDERFSSDQIGVRSIQRVAFRALLAASATKQIVVAGVGL